MESIPLNFRELPEAEMRARAAGFFEAMRTRRTVRDFSDKPVPREVIADCLRTAGSAPSGANLQPWHFVAVSDPAVKRRIREAAEAEEAEFYRHRAPPAWLNVLAPLGTDARKPFLDTASWLIAVFARNSYVGPDGSRQQTYYTKESTGIACGFLIAALHQAGVATLTHTPSPMNFLNVILRRPTSEKPYLLLVAGCPADGACVPAAAARKKPLGEIVTWMEAR